MNGKFEKITTWILVLLSLFGFSVASYLTWVHYNPPLPGEEVFGCIAGGSCAAVNASEYSVIFGIPVALIGTMGYLLIFVLILDRLINKSKNVASLIFLFSLIGAFFQGYLVYISATIIRAYCSLCLMSMATISLITILSFFLAFPCLRELWDKYVE
ncbi:vitamin K epoxide reductase family protein [Candidatus Woesearchaeota archaeon]|nr:vitamin K epoxide reductase family protein [Candidatus Woesearchaeota archaeon]